MLLEKIKHRQGFLRIWVKDVPVPRDEELGYQVKKTKATWGESQFQGVGVEVGKRIWIYVRCTQAGTGAKSTFGVSE